MYLNEYSVPCDQLSSLRDHGSRDNEEDLPPVLYGLEVLRVCCYQKCGLALGEGMSSSMSKAGMASTGMASTRADAPADACRRAW